MHFVNLWNRGNNVEVPCSIDDPCSIVAQAYDRDLYQQQVVFKKPFFLLMFFLHQEMNLQLLKAAPPWVDQRYCSDLWEIHTTTVRRNEHMSNFKSGLSLCCSAAEHLSLGVSYLDHCL